MSSYTYLILATVLILLGICLLWFAGRKKQQLGLPSGRLVYADPGLWGKPESPFYIVDIGLTGKPDYIVQQNGNLLPVEVKNAWSPPAPFDSHILQLGAYCLLIEQTSGKRPPFGVLKYRNRTFDIDYTAALEESVLNIIHEIRLQKNREDAPRSHDEPNRCAHCGFRNVCDQRL